MLLLLLAAAAAAVPLCCSSLLRLLTALSLIGPSRLHPPLGAWCRRYRQGDSRHDTNKEVTRQVTRRRTGQRHARAGQLCSTAGAAHGDSRASAGHLVLASHHSFAADARRLCVSCVSMRVRRVAVAAGTSVRCMRVPPLPDPLVPRWPACGIRIGSVSGYIFRGAARAGSASSCITYALF